MVIRILFLLTPWHNLPVLKVHVVVEPILYGGAVT